MIDKKTYSTLFNRIQNDDVVAYDELYRQFFAPLCVFAGRYLLDKKAVEDCVQDVFLRIWKDRKNLLIEGSIRSYLFSAVKNSCLNVIKKKDIELVYEQYILNTYDEYTYDDLYSVEELANLIEIAISKLPDKHQVVFRMNRFEYLTYKEIAEKQKISIKTVESYIHKSLMMLSSSLKDYLPLLIFLVFL